MGGTDSEQEWPEFMGGPERRGVAPTAGPADSGAEHWRTEVSSSEVHASPVVADGTIYVASDVGLTAVDAATGSVEWTFETDNNVTSAPAVRGDTVYVADPMGTVQAVDRHSGAGRWTTEIDDNVYSSPAVAGGTVYVTSDDCHLYALDAETGEQEWRFAAEDRVRATPTVVDGTVYVGSNDTTVYAVDAETGEQVWRYENGGMWMVRAAPVVDDGTVYVGCRAGSVHAIDAETGEQEWRFAPEDREAVSTVAVGDEAVYVGSLTGRVHALTHDFGGELWRTNLGSSVVSSPVIDGDTLYVGTEDAAVHALDLASGDERWQFEGGATGDSTSTVGGANELLGEQTFLNLLTLDTFTIKEVDKSGIVAGSTPAVVDGTVYVGGQDGNLYAVKSASEASSARAVETDGEAGRAGWNHPMADPARTSHLGGDAPTERPSPAWRDAIEGGGFESASIAVDDGRIFAGSGSEVAAFDLDSGDRLWTADTPPADTGLAAVDGRVFYGGSYEDRLFALDAETGEELWCVHDHWNVETPVVGEGALYVPVDRNLVALDPATGDRQWLSEHDPDRPPLVAHGTVFVLEYDVLSAIDPEIGTEIWSTELRTGPAGEPALSEGSLYLPGDDGTLYCYDPENGEFRWAAETSGDLNTPAVVDDTVYVVSREDALYALAAESGETVWRESLRDPMTRFAATPTVTGGALYVGTTDGDCRAYDAADGDQLWSVGLDANLGTPPVAVDGRLVALDGANTLTAFGSPDTDDGGDRSDQASTGTPEPDTPDTANDGTHEAATNADSTNVGAAATDADSSGSETDGAASARGGADEAGTGEESSADSAEESTDADGAMAGERLDARAGWPTYRGDRRRTGHAGGGGPAEAVAPAWTVDCDGGIGTAAALVDGVLYAGDGYGSVCAYDAESGDRLWSFEAGDGLGGDPVVADGTVYVPDMNQTLHAVDADSGLSEWSFEPDEGAYSLITSTPAVADGTVYVGSVDEHVYAVDAETGEQEWAVRTDDEVSSSPVVADGTVYVGSEDSALYALDAETGMELWTWDVGGFSGIEASPAYDRGTVFVAAGDSTVYALDGETGEKQWATEGPADESSTVVADGTVYLGSYEGTVHALDAATGETVWTVATDATVSATPAVADGVVYAGSTDSSVYAIDAGTGDLLWEFETGNSVVAAPTVGHGAVFVGSRDSSMYALTEGGEAIELPDDAAEASDEDEAGSESSPPEQSGWSVGRGNARRTGTAAGSGPTDSLQATWEFSIEEITKAVAAAGGRVYAVTQGGAVHALEDGQQLWTFETDKLIQAEPTVDDGTVFVGGLDETLHAIDAATGEAVWAFEGSDSFGKYSTAAAVADGVVYAGCEDRTLYAIDAETGMELWSYDTDGEVGGAPAVVDGDVFLCADEVLAIDADLGEKRWEHDTGGFRSIESAPAVAGGTVYVGDPTGAVLALDASTGVEQWQFETDADVSAAPAIADGRVYIADQDGSVYAIDAGTGELTWSTSFSGNTRFESSLAVVDGVVYVAPPDGYLYALDADSGVEISAVEQRAETSPAVADGIVTLGTREGVVGLSENGDDGSASAESSEAPETNADATDGDGAGGAGEPGAYLREAETDAPEPTDDQLQAAILGAICDEWERDNRGAVLTLDAIESLLDEVVPGATDGLLKHNARRLDDDRCVSFEEAYDTVTLRARGVRRFEQLTGVDVVPSNRILEVLEPLYQRARHNPDSPTMGREELDGESYLEPDELDRTVWYLNDLGQYFGDGLYVDTYEGYIDVDVQGSDPWWLSARINKNGRNLYERLE